MEILPKDIYRVEPVSRNDCAPFLLEIHYARRWCSITYAFGLFRNDVLVGVVTYGTPPSSTLRAGIAGKENIHRVLELNRLCLRDNLRNEASMLVGRSLRMLPKGKIVISFADTSQGHVGYVYQATNFTYHGLSAKRTDYVIDGIEGKHSTTITDMYRGVPNRMRVMREVYGDRLKTVPRPRKHRYIYITGKKERKKLYPEIKYLQEPTP